MTSPCVPFNRKSQFPFDQEVMEKELDDAYEEV